MKISRVRRGKTALRGIGSRQYSSASMTVITRTVTTGSAGSGEGYFRFRSK
jgi:hypothetical protein